MLTHSCVSCPLCTSCPFLHDLPKYLVVRSGARACSLDLRGVALGDSGRRGQGPFVYDLELLMQQQVDCGGQVLPEVEVAVGANSIAASSATQRVFMQGQPFVYYSDDGRDSITSHCPADGLGGDGGGDGMPTRAVEESRRDEFKELLDCGLQGGCRNTSLGEQMQQQRLAQKWGRAAG